MLIDPGPPRDDGRLLALLDDMLGAPHRSDWSRSVTDERIRTCDRIRPFATRGLLQLAMLVLLLLLPDVSPWAWVLWLPGLIQTVLELLLEDRVRAKAESVEPGRLFAPVIGFWYRTYEKLPLNITGLVGTVAVIADLFLAVFAVGPMNPPAGKVALLVLAILYAISGILGTLLDTPWFSPLSTINSRVHRLYPFLWVAAVAVAGLAVGIGEMLKRWPDGSLPFAFMACGLGYYIGLRTRDYQRDLRASARVLARASLDAQLDLAMELHNRLQPVKYGLERFIDTADVTGEQRAALRTFFADLRELYDDARKGAQDVGVGLRPTLERRVRWLLNSTGIDYAGSRFELDGRLDGDNHDLAMNLLTNLVQNARQAYERDPFHTDRTVIVSMTTDGPMASIAVQDRLEPIPDRFFAQPGTTLGHLRDAVTARGGELTQTAHSNGKTIAARWSTRPQPLRNARTHEEESEDGSQAAGN